eukprot:27071-Eustigmatos_ZCMA.PRE.1
MKNPAHGGQISSKLTQNAPMGVALHWTPPKQGKLRNGGKGCVRRRKISDSQCSLPEHHNDKPMRADPMETV